MGLTFRWERAVRNKIKAEKYGDVSVEQGNGEILDKGGQPSLVRKQELIKDVEEVGMV
jgi:hypothetical protein